MPICPIDAGRYGTEKMLRVFNEEARLQFMLDVEAAAARAQAILGLIPKEAAEEISSKANLRYVKVDRCREIEESIGHDVMAVVKAFPQNAYGLLHLHACSGVQDVVAG
jgi:adenylosuccinate lyase